MTTRLQVSFDREEAEALARLAASELRDPRDQIRIVVRRELERCGYLKAARKEGDDAQIVEAAKAFARKALESPETIEALDVETFGRFLYAPDIPEPDLLIRTSGEKRISNFMLWQLSYAEVLFTDVLWPDFSREDFQQALKEYARRKRRFGSVEEGEQVPASPSEPSRGYCEE